MFELFRQDSEKRGGANTESEVDDDQKGSLQGDRAGTGIEGLRMELQWGLRRSLLARVVRSGIR